MYRCATRACRPDTFFFFFGFVLFNFIQIPALQTRESDHEESRDACPMLNPQKRRSGTHDMLALRSVEIKVRNYCGGRVRVLEGDARSR